MPKEFKNYKEQIEILKTRGIKFKDEVTAEKHLKRENYYNIINGYKDSFLNSEISLKKYTLYMNLIETLEIFL